jgi:hypothetical protein
MNGLVTAVKNAVRGEKKERTIHQNELNSHKHHIENYGQTGDIITRDMNKLKIYLDTAKKEVRNLEVKGNEELRKSLMKKSRYMARVYNVVSTVAHICIELNIEMAMVSRRIVELFYGKSFTGDSDKE